jgi:hypothetical protein
LRQAGEQVLASERAGSWMKPSPAAATPLALTHLFGISDPTAIRYCTELGATTWPAPPTGHT